MPALKVKTTSMEFVPQLIWCDFICSTDYRKQASCAFRVFSHLTVSLSLKRSILVTM